MRKENTKCGGGKKIVKVITEINLKETNKNNTKINETKFFSMRKMSMINYPLVKLIEIQGKHLNQ